MKKYILLAFLVCSSLSFGQAVLNTGGNGLGNTDSQQISLSGNILTLANGGTVDLTGYLDNTDAQTVTDLSISGNILSITLSGGNTETVDLSGISGTGDMPKATYDGDDNGTVDGIDDNTINSQKIVNGSINGVDIQGESIGSGKLAANSVERSDLQDDIINSTKIANGGVNGSADIQDGSITTIKISPSGNVGQVLKETAEGVIGWADDLSSGGLTSSNIGAVDRNMLTSDFGKLNHTEHSIELTVDNTIPINSFARFQPTDLDSVITIIPDTGVTFVGNGSEVITGGFQIDSLNIGSLFKIADNLFSVAGYVKPYSLGEVPIIEDFTNNWGNSTTPASITLPTGIQNNETLVVIVSDDEADTNTDTFSQADAPTGWTFEGTFGDDVSDTHIGYFWKTADGTETGSLDFGIAGNDFAIVCLRISGADTTDPIDFLGTANTEGFNSSIDVLSVTTTLANSLVVGAVSTDGSDVNYTSISSTGWLYGDSAEGSDSTDNTNISWASKNMELVGVTGNATFNFSLSDGLLSTSVIIKPQQ